LFRDEGQLEYLRRWIATEIIQTQIQLFKELVEEPKKYYNSFNKKCHVINKQYSSMNYSLKVNTEVKEKIRRALVFMQRHYE